MKYLIANWKMNMDTQQIIEWLNTWSQIWREKDEATKNSLFYNAKVIIAPSYCHLPLISEISQKLGLKISAQDVSSQIRGAHTGQVCAEQIKDFCDYCIVGHSETGNDADLIKIKTSNCIEMKIIPMVCFSNPHDVTNVYQKNALMVWEDPNNISVNGEYKQKSSKDVVEGVSIIDKLIPQNTPLLYGGSVNENNIKELAQIKRINGVLVGNASLDPEHFAKIALSLI